MESKKKKKKKSRTWKRGEGKANRRAEDERK
jgi:hypothetical protein